MISLLNSARLTRGVSTLGWLNPILYANGALGTAKSVFNDITSGSTNCAASGSLTPNCCSQGFAAGTGW